MPYPMVLSRRRPRRKIGVPGPVPAAVAPVTTLPQNIVDLRVELLLGALGWTDISTYVLQNRSGPGVTITRGHADESVTTQPSAMTMYLKNADGRFSDKNPAGAYYGYIGRNTSVRVSVPEGASYLRMEYDQLSGASCADAPVLGVTGDLEIQVDVTLDNWNGAGYQVLVSKWNTTGNQRSWILYLSEAGLLNFVWSADGAAFSSIAVSTVAVPVPALRRQAIKVTASAGTGQVNFYTAPAAADQAALGPITSGWVQVGVTLASAAAAVFVSTAPVRAGDATGSTADISGATGIYGKVHSLIVLNGIAGTQVASPNFTTATAGASSLSDAQGNIWALNGTAEISSRRYRFHGEVAAWPQAWDPTGTDVYVAVQAGGLLRRYGQRSKPLNSAMRRYVQRLTGQFAPIAYWPFEDLAGATHIASGLPGGSAMAITGGSPSLAADSTFACAAPLAQVHGAAFQGIVGPYTATATLVCRFLIYAPVPATDQNLIVQLNFSDGTIGSVSFQFDPYSGNGVEGMYVNSYGFGGSTLGSNPADFFNPGGVGYLVSVELVTSGGTVTPTVRALGLDGSSWVSTDSPVSYSGTIGHLSSVVVNPFSETGGALGTNSSVQWCIGHLWLQTAITPLTGLASVFAAWAGEAAAVRFARLCGEDGLAYRIQGNADASVPVGIQTQEAFTALLQECADADRGIIFEPRAAVALGYRCSGSLQNQGAGVALDYSQAHLAGSLQPTQDDQQTRNDVTVTRTGGSSYEAIVTSGPLSVQAPPSGAGTYDVQTTINLAYDGQLASEATWMAHMGTVFEPRYPAIGVDLARSEVAGLYYDLQDLDLGDRLTVANTPLWLPPDGISQLVQGSTENIGGYIWTLAWNCVPESPWRTAVCGSYAADTDGCVLGSAYGTTRTSLTLVTPGTGQPWTTAAGDFPFDILVAGERMTVTAMSGATSPQTATVTRSVNGVVQQHLAGDAVVLFTQPIVPLT